MITQILKLEDIAHILFGYDYKKYLSGFLDCSSKYPETAEILSNDLFYILKEFKRITILSRNRFRNIQVEKFRNFLDNFYLGDWIGKNFTLKFPITIWTIGDELDILLKFKSDDYQDCTSLLNKDGRCAYISIFHLFGTIPEIFKSQKATKVINLPDITLEKSEYYMNLYNNVVDFKIKTLCEFIKFSEDRFNKKIGKQPHYHLMNPAFQNYLVKEIFISFKIYNKPLFDLFYHKSKPILFYDTKLLTPIKDDIVINITSNNNLEILKYCFEKYVFIDTTYFATTNRESKKNYIQETINGYKTIAIYDIVVFDKKDGSWIQGTNTLLTNHAVCHKICPDDGKWMSMSNTDVYKFDSFQEMIDQKMVCNPLFILFEKI